MIRITRTNCPKLLNESPVEGKIYRAESVVNTLYEMQHGKCCYCEMKIPKSGPEKTVEHFRPQERDEFRLLRNDWRNLLLACSGCNGSKGNNFPVNGQNQPLIIDPTDTSVDPEEHLEFIVTLDSDFLYGMVIERNSSEAGRTTINTLKLDNQFLTGRRRDFVHQLCSHYHNMLVAMSNNDKDDVESARALLINCAKPTKEFSACAKEFIEKTKVNEWYNKWLSTRVDN